jgi:sensor histidine kinase YesM
MASLSPPIHQQRRARLRRLLTDLPLSIAISALLACFISLVTGRFLENLLVSVLIGIVAFTIVYGGRLLFIKRPVWRLQEWARFAALAVVAAPIAHFTGLYTAGLLLGIRTPTLAEYPSVDRISMIVFTFLGTTLMVVLIRNRERMRRAQEEQAEAHLRAQIIERQALQAQLRLLQAQIEPHMLFNTLANLQGLIALDPARASDMLDQLIQYLRATLSVSRSETTTLEQEFAAMGAYLGLMGVRMGERLRYRLDLPPALRKARLPTMLLQPLVENAIVHGVEPKIDGGEITISAAIEGDSLVLDVRDTGLGLGPGLGQAPARRGGGVGVATSRERLDALYGERASMILNSAPPQGTLARLTLPLEFEQ